MTGDNFPERTRLRIFLTDNPSPSWSTVAYALWEAEEHGALKVVQKLYLKGQPCVGVTDEIINLIGQLEVHFFIWLVAVLGP